MTATGTKLKHLLFNSPVPEGWEVKTVDQIKADEKYACCAGPFGSSISAKFFVDEGVPVIRGNNLTIGGESFIDNGFVFVSEDKARSFPGQHVRSGDLVFTCWGTLGQVGLIPNASKFEEYIISNKQLKLRVNSEVCNSKFLYYYFSLPQMVRHINDIAIGSAVPGINLGLLKSIKIVLPPKETQDQIVALISSISNLIENNKCRISLLENMAEEIYREWFVRFRFPGWQEAEFEKGLPAGWSIKKLSDVLTLQYGKALKNEDRLEGTVPVYGSSGVVGFHNEALVRRPGIIVGRKGNVGAIHWSDVAFYPIDTVYYVVSDLSEHFLYYLLHSVNFINNDAAVPGLNRKQAYSNEVLVPEDGLIGQFEELVKPLYDHKKALTKMNDNLEKTKSQLLPCLISGKLSVENLDIQLPPSMQSDQSDSADEAAA